LLKVLMVVVFFAVGCLEIISILFRPVSLSFRLYGNIFAGENMLEAMAIGLALADPVLFHGVARRFCPGPCLHAVDRSVYDADLPARGGSRSSTALRTQDFGGLTVFNRGSRRESKER
jgi:hypothetical protein